MSLAGHLVLLIGISLLWTLICAAVARKRQWRPQTCRMFTAWSFIAIGLVQLVLSSPPATFRFIPASLLFTLGPLMGSICRKLVFPKVGWNESDPGEVLSIR
jgi:hypothetical protein